jgi:photosystem II stability/assembly factor-like uncharacterized protein
MRADAELTAITFLDADRGWAVGDRGVIWHTDDGGRNWQAQNSGVGCRLEMVQFLDANNGWAVGGWTQPYTHETHGVVLRTRDGGRTWQNVPGLVLPGLTQARFFDARSGWALGDASPLFPSGVFRTEDGGRTWMPVPKGQTLGWVAGDFRDPRLGVVADLAGTLAIATAAEVRPIEAPDLGTRFVRRLQLVGQAGGWLVGDGGLALATRDAGRTWAEPAGKMPEIAAQLDFRALAVLGNHVWIAGAPGTCVLHSADKGQTWQLQRTQQTAPLVSLFFLDEYRGWAVGALGTILHTRDGGQSWRVQRSGGSRAALVGVFSAAERVPLEIVALESGSDAYLSAIEIIGRRDLEPGASPDEWTLPRRTHAAAVAAGGSAADTAWRFPLCQAGLPMAAEGVLARWNAANDGRAAARLEEHLVRRIRQWQPEVIVTEDVSPRGEDPLAHLTNQMTLAAVTKAAESTAFPEQISQLGLQPWKVKKVFSVQAGERPGVVSITPAQWAPRIGRSLADAAQSGRSLLASDLTRAARTIGLSLLVDHLPQETGRRDVMSGILLAPGSEARRQLAEPPPGDLAQLSDLARKRHNVEQLLLRIGSGEGAAANWLGQIDNLTSGLPERPSGEILWQLAQRYHQTGQSASAAESLELLLTRYPRHALADPAALWLVQYYASSEVAWRNRQGTSYSVHLVSATSQRENPAAAAVATTDKDGAPLEIVDRSQRSGLTGVSQSQTAAPAMTPAYRAGRALALAKVIERTRPTLFARPALQLPLAASQRLSGQEQPSAGPRSVLPVAAHTVGAGTWSACIAAEEWLKDSKGPPPKKLLAAVTASHKPRLDGRLDDPLWQSAKPASLTGAIAADGSLPAAVVLAWDDEFLYFAASCKKAAGELYVRGEEPRPHDSDLSQQDHLVLLLDVDRDYATWWQLAIDFAGRPAASCFGDATWNPQWFIAAGGDEAWWTVEAAIPLAELGPARPQVRDVWAAQVQRVVPQRGVWALGQPATVGIRPEGFGLLVFE